MLQVPIVSMSDCMSVYKNYYITDNMFCAGYRGGRIDSCAGDSGTGKLCWSKANVNIITFFITIIHTDINP